MNRRGFLGSVLAACVAPAIVRADALMRIVPLDTTFLQDGWIVVPAPGDGITDMAPIISRALRRAARIGAGVWVCPGRFKLCGAIALREGDRLMMPPPTG